MQLFNRVELNVNFLKILKFHAEILKFDLPVSYIEQ